MALEITNASKYPILLDGEPADPDVPIAAFGADNGNVVIFRETEDGPLYAKAAGTGTTNLTINHEGRSGAVTVNITNDPIDITFGEPEDL